MNPRKITIWFLEDREYSIVASLDSVFGQNNYELQFCVCLSSALRSIKEIRVGALKRPDILLFDIGIPLFNDDPTAKRLCATHLSDGKADWDEGVSWYHEYVKDDRYVNEFREYLRAKKTRDVIKNTGDSQVGTSLARYCLEAVPGAKMMVYSGQAQHHGLKFLGELWEEMIHFWGKDPASCPDWPDIVDYIATSQIQLSRATLAPVIGFVEDAYNLSGEGKHAELEIHLEKLKTVPLISTTTPSKNSPWTLETLMPIRMQRLKEAISQKTSFQKECLEIVAKFGKIGVVRMPQRGLWNKDHWKYFYLFHRNGTKWQKTWSRITDEVEKFLQRYYSTPEKNLSTLNSDDLIQKELVSADLDTIPDESHLAAVLKHRLLILGISHGTGTLNLYSFYDKLGMVRAKKPASDKYYLLSTLGFPFEVGGYDGDYNIVNPETIEEEEWIAKRYFVEDSFPELVSLLGKVRLNIQTLPDPRGPTVESVEQFLLQCIDTTVKNEVMNPVRGLVNEYLNSDEAKKLSRLHESGRIMESLRVIAGV